MIALEDIVSALGVKAGECNCEGCREEAAEAARIARAVLTETRRRGDRA